LVRADLAWDEAEPFVRVEDIEGQVVVIDEPYPVYGLLSKVPYKIVLDRKFDALIYPE
jgi:hypothetical protein